MTITLEMALGAGDADAAIRCLPPSAGAPMGFDALSQSLMNFPAERRVEVLDAAEAAGIELDTPDAMDHAASAADVSWMRWLIQRGVPSTEDTAKFLMTSTYVTVDALAFARDNGVFFPRDSMDFVAQTARVDLLQWARDAGFHWTDDTAGVLIARCPSDGDTSALAYALAHGCPVPSDVLDVAARTGRVPTMRFLRERGFAWSMKTAKVLARRGFLSGLKYARADGCPFPADVMDAAARSASVRVIQWLRSEGFEWTRRSALLLRGGAARAFALANGCPR